MIKYKTLFLDRDGVINVRIVGDYIKKWEEFEFAEGVLEALKIFAKKFDTIVVVTNQQGIGKGLMTTDTLDSIHSKMKECIENAGGKIDEIYFCPALSKEGDVCRKPNIGMGLKARKQFPQIKFRESIMVGDSISDMQFGKKLGMKTIFISESIQKTRDNHKLIDERFNRLIDFAKNIENE